MIWISAILLFQMMLSANNYVLSTYKNTTQWVSSSIYFEQYLVCIFNCKTAYTKSNKTTMVETPSNMEFSVNFYHIFYLKCILSWNSICNKILIITSSSVRWISADPKSAWNPTNTGCCYLINQMPEVGLLSPVWGFTSSMCGFMNN